MYKPRQPKKHLFFITGPVPTQEQDDEAAELGGFVCFRNANMIDPGESCEPFDELHGDIPAQYLAARDAKLRGEEIDTGPRSEPIGTVTGEVDNGDGTKTTTWRPNVGTA